MKNINEYLDIISLPHYKSKTRKQMTLQDRACQFAPFAALTGYEDQLEETSRLTNQKKELDDNLKEELTMKLQIINEKISNKTYDFEVTVIYFMPDIKKTGGSYQTYQGIIKKIDEYERKLLFINNLTISIDDIIEIRSDNFNNLL